MTTSSGSSWAERFQALPLELRRKRLESLSPDERGALQYLWEFWARPSQLLPPGDWDVWMVMAGRGFGKTRTGAETVRQWARKPGAIIHIIAPTAGDVRKVILDGPAGIRAVCAPSEQPRLRTQESTLIWPNGAKALLFSAEEPERLRGPQCHKLWADELAAWRYQQETWDLAMMGLRLGDNPQAVVTTTPKPTKLVKEIIGSPRTLLTRGTTYENRSNLAAKFYASIITKYEGTRLGRQELNAEVLEDNPGALFTLANIDANRVTGTPWKLPRVVVAIDPSTTSDPETSDECGIVVAALDDNLRRPEFYVLEDLSDIYSPNEWAKVAVAAYKRHKADRIVAETNNGGDMVEAVIRTVDANVAYTSIHATRGKAIRAEPIAGLYEQNRVHHVGTFSKLEDQMCDYNPLTAEKSPDRMDALVWALWELSERAVQGGGWWIYAQEKAAEARDPRLIEEKFRKQFSRDAVLRAEEEAPPGLDPNRAECGAKNGPFVCNARPHAGNVPHVCRENGRIVASWRDEPGPDHVVKTTTGPFR